MDALSGEGVDDLFECRAVSGAQSVRRRTDESTVADFPREVSGRSDGSDAPGDRQTPLASIQPPAQGVDRGRK
jgi:hypothetical protein